MTCCFTGHRSLSHAELKFLVPELKKTIRALAAEGYTIFRSGGALGFDTIAALSVLDLKKELDIQLEIYIPCRDQDKMWPEKDKKYYRYILASADRCYCLSEYYTPSCMHNRNRKMVDGSDACIAFCKQNSGGTAYTVIYALKNNVRLINLADNM